MKKIIIIVVLILIVIICFFEIGIRSFILAPNISEFIPEFKKDGIFLYEDYQEDDFDVEDYYSYKYNIFSKEFILEKPVGLEYGASSKKEALFSYPKEVAEKYKIYEFKKGKYVIYERFQNMCSGRPCIKKELKGMGTEVESKDDFDYSKYTLDTNKKLEGKYIFGHKNDSSDTCDTDAYIELHKNGTFSIYKYKKVKKGTYKIVNFKYNMYKESVMLKYNDNDTYPIYLEIVDTDNFCKHFDYCEGDLKELSLGKINSDEYRLDGLWKKEK